MPTSSLLPIRISPFPHHICPCPHPRLHPFTPSNPTLLTPLHLRKLRLALDDHNILKLGPHLDNRVADHPGVKTHRLLHSMLCLCARIEPHDEVVAVVVRGL